MRNVPQLVPDDGLKTDFHALRILVCVHQAGSIRAAADMLDMNQSNVSYAIDRLRKVFADPLFVRLGRGIVPTQRCGELVKGAEELLRKFEGLTAASEFDPGTAQDCFVLSCNFYERAIFLPALVRRLRKEAPNVKLSIIQANAEGHRQLEAGDCDLVIAPLSAGRSGFYSQRLLTERYACFVAPGSRFAREPMTLENYAAARHIIVKHAYNWKPFYREVLERLGISFEPVLEVPSFGEVDKVVANSDLVLTASEGFARLYVPRVTCIPAPFECLFPVEMFWAGRNHTAPSHRWFRGLVEDVAAELRISASPLQRQPTQAVSC